MILLFYKRGKEFIIAKSQKYLNTLLLNLKKESQKSEKFAQIRNEFQQFQEIEFDKLREQVKNEGQKYFQVDRAKDNLKSSKTKDDKERSWEEFKNSVIGHYIFTILGFRISCLVKENLFFMTSTLKLCSSAEKHTTKIISLIEDFGREIISQGLVKISQAAKDLAINLTKEFGITQETSLKEIYLLNWEIRKFFLSFTELAQLKKEKLTKKILNWIKGEVNISLPKRIVMSKLIFFNSDIVKEAEELIEGRDETVWTNEKKENPLVLINSEKEILVSSFDFFDSSSFQQYLYEWLTFDFKKFETRLLMSCLKTNAKKLTFLNFLSFFYRISMEEFLKPKIEKQTEKFYEQKLKEMANISNEDSSESSTLNSDLNISEYSLNVKIVKEFARFRRLTIAEAEFQQMIFDNGYNLYINE